jgi:hypothetical protein
MARKFLYWVAGLIGLAVLGFIALTIFGPQIMMWTAVPRMSFAESTPSPTPDYAQAGAWIARPDMANSPGLETPPGFQPAPRPAVDVFYFAPTTFLLNTHWNAPLEDAEANRRLIQAVRHQASAFNAVGAIWAPRYRHAAFGAFLTDKPDAAQAFDLAYADVKAAWTAFLAQRDASRPILLAGHSQGSMHLLRLLDDVIIGSPEQAEIVAAYVVGWPVSVPSDLPALEGMPLCQTPAATGCLISWQSFGTPANPKYVRAAFDKGMGLAQLPRAGTSMVCVNPLSFWADQRAASADQNLGSLAYAKSGEPLEPLLPGIANAQCKPDGVVHIDPSPPKPFTDLVTFGENYHTYDYNLFWGNVRANAQARVEAFLGPRTAAQAATQGTGTAQPDLP